MKILDAATVRAWDQFTIREEPINPLMLMERAATACVEWIALQGLLSHPFTIFCGKGNNGGDGLAIARLLSDRFCSVEVWILESGQKGTDEFQANLEKLHLAPVNIGYIQSSANLHSFPASTVIIDAVFGTGLNRPLEGMAGALIAHINQAQCHRIAVDIPSGLFTDKSSTGNLVVHADDTLAFQCYKPAFLVAENAGSIGDIHILDIGLDPGFLNDAPSAGEIIDSALIRKIYRRRGKFAHKGNFGHALLVAGSRGKMGAAVLAAIGCLRSGSGLLTCHIPSVGEPILQSAIPEAMADPDINPDINTKIDHALTSFNVIGIGPGLGKNESTAALLRTTLHNYSRPMVIDADALNIISEQQDLLELVPSLSVLTPHPKEFVRLFGSPANDFDMIQLALNNSAAMNLIIVLKGHHTCIACPDGNYFFNTTGNPGMAKGGSGDALTGIITGLLAQGYMPAEAAILGVYCHGLAGDLAAARYSEEAMLATDLLQCLGEAFKNLSRDSFK